MNKLKKNEPKKKIVVFIPGPDVDYLALKLALELCKERRYIRIILEGASEVVEEKFLNHPKTEIIISSKKPELLRCQPIINLNLRIVYLHLTQLQKKEIIISSKQHELFWCQPDHLPPQPYLHFLIGQNTYYSFVKVMSSNIVKNKIILTLQLFSYFKIYNLLKPYIILFIYFKINFRIIKRDKKLSYTFSI